MSNTVVGSAYAQIIERVVQASQIDFEEGGIERQTLNELRDNWQKRLSSLRIAQFPWDPAPAPSNTQSYPGIKSAPANDVLDPSSASADGGGSYNGVRIKTEENESNAPGLMNGFPTSNMNTQVAQQRAVSFMEQNFGSQATASIGALQQQTGLSLPGQSRPHGLQLPGQITQPQPQQQQQQSPSQQQAAQPQSATKSEFPPNAVGAEQTDGSGDAHDEWMNIRTSVSMNGNESRLAADETLRQKVEQLAELMDSGLMLPLDEHRRHRRSKKNKGKQRVNANATDVSGQQLSSPSSSSLKPLPALGAKIPQYDGVLEDEKRIKTEEDGEEVDEDAINSDLDDSDDDLDKEQDEGEDLGETMLCLYEKVQRVKNKWKCVLKDGILTTNQKEYLFQRATGEFEW